MKNKKGLVTIGVLLGLGAIAYLVFKKKKDDKSGNGGSGSGGVTPTIDFNSMADKIFDAMDGYGTANTKIENELKRLQNKSDWDMLVSAFGTRTVSSGRGNIFSSDFTGTLPECLKDELDSAELSSANQILSKVGVRL